MKLNLPVAGSRLRLGDWDTTKYVIVCDAIVESNQSPEIELFFIGRADMG